LRLSCWEPLQESLQESPALAKRDLFQEPLKLFAEILFLLGFVPIGKVLLYHSKSVGRLDNVMLESLGHILSHHCSLARLLAAIVPSLRSNIQLWTPILRLRLPEYKIVRVLSLVTSFEPAGPSQTPTAAKRRVRDLMPVENKLRFPS
jgi:hypothetical protein